jgi:hypothetical protein
MYSTNGTSRRKITSGVMKIRLQHTFSAGETLDDLQKVLYSKLGIFSRVLVTSIGVSDEVTVTALLLETLAYFF